MKRPPFTDADHAFLDREFDQARRAQLALRDEWKTFSLWKKLFAASDYHQRAADCRARLRYCDPAQRGKEWWPLPDTKRGKREC